MMGQDQPFSLLWRQPVFNEGQVQVLITSVNFVSHDRMANVGKVDSNLVFSSRLWSYAQHRKRL